MIPAPFVEDICTYLAANSSGRFNFASGSSNLKIGELVHGDNGVYAIAVGGAQPDEYTAIEYHTIDFWAQNNNSRAAMDDLRTIYALFHQAHHFQTTNYYVHFCQAVSQPTDLDRSGEGSKLARLSVIFTVMSLIS